LSSKRGVEMGMQWRKSPQQLIDLFVSVIPDPPAVQRKMFGYPAAFVNGNMFMSLFQDDMILRLPESLREEFLRVDGTKIFEPMPGRPMREYIAVPPQVMADKKKLAAWVSRALDYGASLKPKSRTSKPKKAATKSKRPVSTKKKK
jgi:TfoX/Sxy family transcriptional regulator of competence genes